MRTIYTVLAALLCAPGLANEAEVERLTQDLTQRAVKGQWAGAERAFEQIEQLTEPAGSTWWLGAQSAANLGDASTAYRRVVFAERAELGATEGAFYRYLAEYGQVAVHRVQASCISLEPLDKPFDPLHAAAIERATQELAERGSFYGMLPEGSYRVGGYELNVMAGPGLAELRRTKDDGDCR